MVAVFIVLSVLLALLPGLTMMDGALVSGLIAAIVAVATLTTALMLNSNELSRFARLLTPMAFVALVVPGVWMSLQVLPMPARSLANPIWVSASAALDRPFAGAVSMDIGATLLVLGGYCTCLAAALVAAAVGLNQSRAKSVLYLLTIAATLIAAELIAFDLGYSRVSSFAPTDAAYIAVVGFVLSAAVIFQNYEQLVTHSARRKSPQIMSKVTMSTSGAALAVCLSAILLRWEAALVFAALFGAAVLISPWAIRRLQLGLWGQTGIAALAAILVVGFFATMPQSKGVDTIVASSTQDRPSPVERMLSDARWVGSGAGAFEALSAIYRDADEHVTSRTPTTAAVIAIEMGPPFLWACVVAFLMGAATLFRRSLLRRRDSVYPSVGGGCMAALLITLFASEGVLGLTAWLVTGVVCGLAFAQSKTTTNHALDSLQEVYASLSRAADDIAVDLPR
jgi:hypothetical protein